MKKVFLILLLIFLIVFFLLPFLASKAFNFFLAKKVERKIGGKVWVTSSASPLFLFNYRFNSIKGRIENFRVSALPQSKIEFFIEGGRINIPSFLKGGDLSSWFTFRLVKVKGKVSEENLNEWLVNSNRQFKVNLKNGKLRLIWQKNGRSISIPGKLKLKEGGIYFLPEASFLLKLYLGRGEILVWERPEINFTSIHIKGRYLFWEGEIREDIVKTKF